MKNLVKWFGTVVLVAIVGFSLISCVIDGDGGSTHTHTWGDWRSNSTQHWRVCTDCGEESTRASHTGTPNCTVCGYQTGSSPNLSLNGIWGSEGYVYISINGNTGTITQISSTNALYLNAISKGYIKIGDAKFRNITKTGDLTWRYEELTVRYNSSAPNVALSTTWEDGTITLNANGLSFNRYAPGVATPSRTWIKTMPTLEGSWEAPNYVIVTINGNTGTLTQISGSNALYLNAVSKGYIKIGDAKFRNITKTGDLTWRYEELTVRYNSSAPNVALSSTWEDGTITLNANGLSFNRYAPGVATPSRTWTRW